MGNKRVYLPARLHPGASMHDVIDAVNDLRDFVAAEHERGPENPTIYNVVGDMPRTGSNRFDDRYLYEIEYIVIHHVGHPAMTVTPAQIASYHIRRYDWESAGYHFYIRGDGKIYQLNRLVKAAFHCGSKQYNPDQTIVNENAIGVCLEGSFMGHVRPTPAQLDACRALNTFLLDTVIVEDTSWTTEVAEATIFGHKDFRQTSCPGDTWGLWKDIVIPNGA